MSGTAEQLCPRLQQEITVARTVEFAQPESGNQSDFFFKLKLLKYIEIRTGVCCGA